MNLRNDCDSYKGVINNSIPTKIKDCKYLVVSFISDGKRESESDRCIDAEPAVM